MATYEETLTDAITVSRVLVNAHGKGVVSTDNVRLNPVLDGNRAFSEVLVDGLSVTDAAAAIYAIDLIEAITIGLDGTVNANSNVFLEEVLELRRQLAVTLPADVIEAVEISSATLVQQVVQVLEDLELTSLIEPSLTYNLTVVERLQLADLLVRFIGAFAVDEISVADLAAAVAGHNGVLTDGIEIEEEIEPRFLLRVVCEETILVDPIAAVRMLFGGELIDGIEITAGYLAPGNSITTWAMNTRTAAITEYQNYAFNSFAQIGNKYLGAADDGLYELVGDDDDGTDVIAAIKSGFAQWTGTHQGTFKAAYLAVRGEGEFVLRILSREGKTYNYTVTASSMRVTKVNMGKGLRARYFAFELISTGQDFELDTLEFMPLVLQRRV